MFQSAVEDLQRYSLRYHVRFFKSFNLPAIMSTNPALPLGCKLRKYSFAFLRRFGLQLGVFSLLLIFVLYLRTSFRWRRQRRILLQELAKQVFEVLSKQKELALRDPYVPAYLSVNHLRDTFTAQLPRLQRLRIWEGVRGIVASNSCVCEYLQLVGGEDHRVWEWNAPSILSPTKDSFHSDHHHHHHPIITTTTPRAQSSKQRSSSPSRETSTFESFQKNDTPFYTPKNYSSANANSATLSLKKTATPLYPRIERNAAATPPVVPQEQVVASVTPATSRSGIPVARQTPSSMTKDGKRTLFPSVSPLSSFKQP